ncbi:accessory Sec system translocase SecA2 [Levilactobacillus bambusae]|uniref:Protein translocase subunit SecA n=2 Tax=Levilactobacillus bambusae TaxID=2024736 RepID=A0A2V1MYN9_9LACO|nr:accessory Sec system translocase SecA2 [Levilactobacillus bambusae]
MKLHKYRRIANRIEKLAPKYQAMSDEDLQAQTQYFRNEIQKGRSLTALMPEAFAAICEADFRVLGLRPYYEQILGGIVLHIGSIAEMKTGEGKTLTATMPMYLNGLTGPGNFLITANEYLARRDAEDIGRVYEWMGLTVASGVPEMGQENAESEKKRIYDSDIVYTTNSAIGFDYLLDNLAASREKQYLHQFGFALIDEIDAILLDMAATPLVISGSPRVKSDLFVTTDQFVKLLTKKVDYQLSDDMQNVWYTEEGLKHAEHYFGIDNVLSEEWHDLYRHLEIALKANFLYLKGRDYVVSDKEVVLLDRTNGRLMTGTKLQSGMHQGLEAKEGVNVSVETRAMASITYQNLFRMFHKLSGMSGTAKTDAAEFAETYNLDTFVIPTHKPTIRDDLKDQLFVSNEEKIEASVDVVKKAYEAGRPILIETGSITMSELYSRVLIREGIPHNLLNAGSAAKEARIVAEAGQKKVVTVATSMAGRGTDIKLGEGVEELGGLFILGTERMESARIDNQLRGRAGRQGSPGESIFYVSLEDDVVIRHAPKRIRLMWQQLRRSQRDGKRPLGNPLTQRSAKRIINSAQKSAENSKRSGRRNTLEYDEIMRIQRNMIYDTRNEIMDQTDLSELTQTTIRHAIDSFFIEHPKPTPGDLVDFIDNNVEQLSDLQLDASLPVRELKQQLFDKAWNDLLARQGEFEEHDQFLYFVKVAFIKAIDASWIEQVDNLQQLKTVTGERSSAGHEPLYEYQKEARQSFRIMRQNMWETVLRNLMLSKLYRQKDGTVKMNFP